MESRELGNSRDLTIYLPPGYARAGGGYPVIYMQDGQNLFDPMTSFAEPWRIDDAMRREAAHGVHAIIVGIPNMGKDRIAEYSPFVDAKVGGGKGDLYIDWIVGTVKPLLDRRFHTRPERQYTGIAGSSMGGLISLYAYLREPATFGSVAVMSPSLWFAQRSIFSTLAASGHYPGRIYLDIGHREGAAALEDARRMRAALVAKGYEEGRELKWVEDPDGRHSEVDWGRRFGPAVSFMLRGE